MSIWIVIEINLESGMCEYCLTKEERGEFLLNNIKKYIQWKEG